jgi:hypothetical protein
MKEPPEKSTKRELAEKAIEAGAGLIPIVGSPLATVFAYMVSWSHNERMKLWLEDLAHAVDEMQETLEELTDDDVFLDAVVNATRAAQATHQQEKLDALRNGVVHSVGPDAPTIDEQARFFRLIEEFTPSHLRLLAFLDDPGAVFDAAGIARPELMAGARSHLLEAGMPEFRGQKPWYDLLMSDLTRASLVVGQLGGMQTGGSLWVSATSDLGKRFLAFIADDAEPST